MAGNFNIKNANGKTLTIQNPDTNNADIVIDGSKIASTVSPAFTGNPTAPTQTAQDNSTRLATTAYVDGKFIRGTAVATTSGTAIDFTGVPSWVKRITIMFNGVSTSGSSAVIVQIGNGSIQNSGYLGAGSSISGSVTTTNYTNGFPVGQSTQSSAFVRHGRFTLENISGNTWISNSIIAQSDAPQSLIGCGNKTLSGTLDRLRITTVNETDTFDAGSVNIMYEG